jgi:hypothetical protein
MSSESPRKSNFVPSREVCCHATLNPEIVQEVKVRKREGLDENHDGSCDGDSCASESTALEVGTTADPDLQGARGSSGSGGLDGSGSGSGCDDGSRSGGGGGRDDADGGLGNDARGAGDDNGDSGFLAGGGRELAAGPDFGGGAVKGNPFGSSAGDGGRAPVALGEDGGGLGRRIGGRRRGRCRLPRRCRCRDGGPGGRSRGGTATSCSHAGEEESGSGSSKRELHF